MPSSPLTGLAAALALSLVVACGSRSDAARDLGDAPPKLDDGWLVAAPAETGAKVSLLDSMLHYIDAGEYTGIHSVLVARGGRLVVEEYFDGHDRDTPHDMRSATKSIGSMLTGIAIDRGAISSESDSVYRYFERDYKPRDGWSRRARAVELRHILSMMSGYDCDDHATNFGCENAMYQSEDWVQYALDLPFARDPGENWAYNSASLILVGEAIARGSGMPLDEFAERYLFEPLGIEHFHWHRSPKGRSWIGGSAHAVPREMARLGQLMLQRGVWNGERILSEEWVERSTRRQGDMQGGVDYGYLWQCASTWIESELVAAYWASGNGGQYIIVFPDHDLVAVFTGGNYDSPRAGQPFRMLTRYILPAFLRPEPLGTVDLESGELDRLCGVYRLDFEPMAMATISRQGEGLLILTPDNERVALTSRSPLRFSGSSRWGPLTITFEEDDSGEVARLTTWGSFARFVFEK